MTRVIKNVYNVSSFKSSKKTKKFGNFYILPSSKCYGISWEDWEKFFQPDQLFYVKAHIKDSFFVHLWNKFSDSRNTMKGDKTALNKIAAEHCPKIYEASENYF